MRLERLAARGFRNIEDVELHFPTRGVALLGDNGQGKTNILEAVYYPVFFRSFHGTADQEITRFGGPGFTLDADLEPSARRAIRIRFASAGRKKQIEFNGTPAPRLADHVGEWLAVAFLPQDLSLAAGPASERRRFLDRMLAIADRRYYRALAQYRSALAQRNAALKLGRADLARVFDEPLSVSGAAIVAARLDWVHRAEDRLNAELVALGEAGSATMKCTGDPALAERDAWEPALNAGEARDRQHRSTGLGPHRNDLRIGLDGHSVREFGSTGQQRSVAIALKLLELATLESSRQARPALLLDDVFAELDRQRQHRLAGRLADLGERQVFLTSPREDELPSSLELPVWRVHQGRVRTN